MRALLAAAVVALAALVAPAAANLTEAEVQECVAECAQLQDAGLHCKSHYADSRPFPLLLGTCQAGWRAGTQFGCARACARDSCFGLSVSPAMIAKRDTACKSYENQMPRPTVLEVCREGFGIGAETRCHHVEAELARARAEEADEVRQRAL